MTIDGFELTLHAQYQMQVRRISPDWVAETLQNPERLVTDADSAGNTHYLRRIEAAGNRWLRVVVNPMVSPKKIVTLFLDRRIK
jgi:esterase/lipase superfamily enzyme